MAEAEGVAISKSVDLEGAVAGLAIRGTCKFLAGVEHLVRVTLEAQLRKQQDLIQYSQLLAEAVLEEPVEQQLFRQPEEQEVLGKYQILPEHPCFMQAAVEEHLYWVRPNSVLEEAALVVMVDRQTRQQHQG